MQGNLDTIGKRLRWAIERRPAAGKERGVRKFQRDMEALARELEGWGEPSFDGWSLPSIMSYLNDDTTPSVEFLREAADLLNVEEAWLAFGTGSWDPLASTKYLDMLFEGSLSPDQRELEEDVEPGNSAAALARAVGDMHQEGAFRGLATAALMYQLVLDFGFHLPPDLRLSQEHGKAVADAFLTFMLLPQLALGTEEANFGPRWEEACRAAMEAFLLALPAHLHPSDRWDPHAAMIRLVRVAEAIRGALEVEEESRGET